MTFQFKRKDGLTMFLPGAVHIADFAALMTGVKPVIYCTMKEDEIPAFRAFAESFGLIYSLPSQNKRLRYYPSGGQRPALLSLSKTRLRRAEILWAAGRAQGENKEWSVKILGYPPCCWKFFLKWRDQLEQGSEDLIQRICANSGSKYFPFQLNNIFNLSSRLDAFPSKHKRLAGLELRRFPEALPFSASFLIPWQPCSYRCASSLKAASKIQSFFRAFLPGFFLKLKNVLNRPVLYLNPWEFAVLEGRRRGSGCRFKGYLRPRFGRAPGPLAVLSRADRVSTLNQRLFLYKGDRRLKELPETARLLFF